MFLFIFCAFLIPKNKAITKLRSITSGKAKRTNNLDAAPRHEHGAELAILVPKQGETCFSGDFLQENVRQSEIFVEMLAKHIN